MKFGISFKFEEIVKEKSISVLKQEGLDIVEISYMPYKLLVEEIPVIKDKFNYSIHAPYNNMRINFPTIRYPKIAVEEVKTAITNAINLEARELIMHAGGFCRGYIRVTNIVKKKIALNLFLEKFVKRFGPILREADDKGLKVLIENNYTSLLLGRMEDIIYVQDKLPFLGFCLDIAHSEIYNQTEDLMELPIDHVHISDNNKRQDQNLKIGDGVINYKEILTKLKQKYNKKVIIECRTIDEGIESLKKLKSIV